MKIVKGIILIGCGLFAVYIVIGLIIDAETMLFALAFVSVSIAIGFGIGYIIVKMIEQIIREIFRK